MTEHEKAEIARIEKERRRREAVLAALLLAYVDQARRYAGYDLRRGTDPRTAATDVLLGNPTLHLPGIVPKLATGLYDVHVAAQAHVAREAGAVIPSPVTADVLPIYRTFARTAAERIRDAVSGLVQSVLDKVPTLEQAPTINQIIRTMNEVFAARGWSPRNQWQAEAQAETLANAAWSAGSWAGYKHPAIWTAIKGFGHHSILDDGTTKICRPRDGLRLLRDDPYWDRNITPLHWRCRSVVLAIFENFQPSTIDLGTLPPPMPGFGTNPGLSFGYSFNDSR